MSSLEIAVRLVAGVLLTMANAFFVTTEFALTRLPDFEREEHQDTAGLRRAWAMTDELEIYLTGCQLGITTTSILLGIVAEPAVTHLMRPLFGLFGLPEGIAATVSIVVAVVIINLIHKIWGEQAPTYLGVERPLAVASRTAQGHYWWTQVTKPFIYLGDGLAKWTLGLFGITISRSWTEAEVGDGDEGTENGETPNGPRYGSRETLTRQMAGMMQEQNIPADRRQEVLRALEIGTLPVRRVMVPRDEAVVFSTQRSLQENLRTAQDAPHSRFPLVDASMDEVVGIVYVPILLRHWDDLRAGRTDLVDLAYEAVTVPADEVVSQVIDRLQAEEQEMAFVEQGGHVVGLVTITDAFEAIVGELEDPMDAEQREAAEAAAA
jgi:CBS domain containing-hemolysin-like protein